MDDRYLACQHSKVMPFPFAPPVQIALGKQVKAILKTPDNIRIGYAFFVSACYECLVVCCGCDAR